MGRLLQLPWLGILHWSIFDHFCPGWAAARTEQPLPGKADKTQLPGASWCPRRLAQRCRWGGGCCLAEFRLCAVEGSTCHARGGGETAFPAQLPPAGTRLCPNLAGSRALVISLSGHSNVICLTLVWRMTREQQPIQKVRLPCQVGLGSMNNISCLCLFISPGFIRGGTQMQGVINAL